MSKEVMRYCAEIRPNVWYGMAMPHCGEVVRDIPLPRSFKPALMDEAEYRLIELKEEMAVLEIEGSLTMQVPVSNLDDSINKLRDLQIRHGEVMVTVVSGPRRTKDRVEMVQCVVDARIF